VDVKQSALNITAAQPSWLYSLGKTRCWSTALPGQVGLGHRAGRLPFPSQNHRITEW